MSRVRVAQADLGEADGIGLAEQVRPVVVDLDDADRERVERAARERDRLAGGGARAAVEHDVHRSSAVERQHRVRDVAVAPAVERLHEVDVVGGDLAVEVDLDALPRASPNAWVRHAVVGSPSSAAAGRSSGQYVFVLPYAVATTRCTPIWSVVVSADGCWPGNTSSRASPGSVVSG